MRAKLIGLITGVALTPIAFFFAVASAGAGHGDYVLARVLYPFSILSTHLTESITLVGISIACVQFPIYGWLLGAAFSKKKKKLFIVLATAGVHAVAVSLVFIYSNGFTR